jgi:NhaA family Na+:H+ antiporter
MAALGLLVVLFILSYRNVYSKYLTFAFGTVIWFLFYKAGIHPTIAGVLVAFTVPIRQQINLETYIDKLCEIVANVQHAKNQKAPLLSEKQIEEIDNLEDWTDKVQSPLQHLEHKLHNWVAYLVMPVFALSNAGVTIGGGTQMDLSLAGQIGGALVAGKLIGITLFSWIGVKSKLADLPTGVHFKQIIGTGLIAGVGFTMSIFVANLAFTDDPALLDSAKVGVLAGSLMAGLAGYLVLRLNARKAEVSPK